MAHGKTARALVNIFRGTYLRARTRLPSVHPGDFWFGVTLVHSGSFAAWEVSATDKELYSECKFRGQKVVLAMDSL